MCTCSRWDPWWECAFPQVSATFAASLVSSPAIGAYLSASYGDNLVVLVATVVALLDICFILLAVPESLPEKMRPLSWGAQISWKQADPFAVNKNKTLTFLNIFLSRANKRTLQASQQLLIDHEKIFVQEYWVIHMHAKSKYKVELWFILHWRQGRHVPPTLPVLVLNRSERKNELSF